MLLAGDVGGTKTELAIFSPEGGPRAPVAQEVYPSLQYGSLEVIVRDFLQKVKISVDHACIAVAGPVLEGESKITNLTWVVNLRSLQQELGTGNIAVINDLQAIALAVPILTREEIVRLNVGDDVEHGAIAVIAPGTGMGQAFLTWNGARYQAHPSEGGHADFAPNNPIQTALLGYLQGRIGHVSVERVCSGRGLPNIYAFLRESGYAAEQEEVAAGIATAEDPVPIIMEYALRPDNPSPLCLATVGIFVQIFGAAAGNLGLSVLSTGGVYLAGGIPPKILPVLQDGRFMQAFVHKGRLSDLLERMPVHVVLSRAALLGAAHYGLQMHQESRTA